jgi:hypothetical protein
LLIFIILKNRLPFNFVYITETKNNNLKIKL